eukprot:748392-Amphidinium_carterae.1
MTRWQRLRKAMSLVWRYAEATGNEKWKGLAWGMYLSHASSVLSLAIQAPSHLLYSASCQYPRSGSVCVCTAQTAASAVLADDLLRPSFTA